MFLDVCSLPYKMICKILFFTFLMSNLVSHSLCEGGGQLQDYTNCGSSAAIKEVRISSCTSQPCDLKVNSNIKLEVVFQLNKPVQNIEIAMYGIVLEPLETRWNGVQKDACSYLVGTGCPITDVSKPITYQNSFNVNALTPLIPVTVKVQFTDPQTSDSLVCFKLKAKIVH